VEFPRWGSAVFVSNSAIVAHVFLLLLRVIFFPQKQNGFGLTTKNFSVDDCDVWSAPASKRREQLAMAQRLLCIGARRLCNDRFVLILLLPAPSSRVADVVERFQS